MIDIDIKRPLLEHILAMVDEYYCEYYYEERYSDYYNQKLTPTQVAKIVKKEYEEYLRKKGEL